MLWWVWLTISFAIIFMLVACVLGGYVFMTRPKEEEKFDSSSLLNRNNGGDYIKPPPPLPELQESEYDVVPENEYDTVPESQYDKIPEKPSGYGDLPTENVYDATTSKLEELND